MFFSDNSMCTCLYRCVIYMYLGLCMYACVDDDDDDTRESNVFSLCHSLMHKFFTHAFSLKYTYTYIYTRTFYFYSLLFEWLNICIWDIIKLFCCCYLYTSVWISEKRRCNNSGRLLCHVHDALCAYAYACMYVF